MNDIEIDAVWDFLNESNLDELVGDEVVSAGDAACFLESAFEASIAAFNAGDASPSKASVTSNATSVESTSDDEAPPANSERARRPKLSKEQRERQKTYDRKYRQKKDGWRTEAAKAFVAGLKLLNVLLEDRIQRTRKVSATMRLLYLGKDERKFPDFDRDMDVVNHEAKTQLGLNQAAKTYIELWTATWTLSKIEKGKFFLKPYVLKIEENLQGLAKLGEKLAESTLELEWCLDQKPKGVWI
ncbi:hypothetical protein F441_09357 [Phytophthora nicotianae CJ01A1]|uniref:Uncharacterized protein n=6 Tax=Phytophthora nicotianae TaxID=4792 RepID=W2Q7M4_PHYN3|nr:hypothetical protein PPTG_12327 [Phytophthora nicotianae INRA-310]ETI46196.1 hypothetical protein F443_09395 [Phytophthora nicotianae P1569]ETK86129.1 hypothetical protein L915_09214 [Phytophthora nicotianae]ETO74877.1 hypothetical protein F444_09482 [Phytophthora nicotianae P1976]ETP15994.1 hypothetical protein F441_09357 [Phytophthora nicotianae CJ01A1]ETL39552.1 hypothetical protein L916_09127 [Phytophthora nicotianae]